MLLSYGHTTQRKISDFFWLCKNLVQKQQFPLYKVRNFQGHLFYLLSSYSWYELADTSVFSVIQPYDGMSCGGLIERWKKMCPWKFLTLRTVAATVLPFYKAFCQSQRSNTSRYWSWASKIRTVLHSFWLTNFSLLFAADVMMLVGLTILDAI